MWISPATAARLGTALDDGGVLLELRLADPDQAESFAAAHPEVVGDTWQDSKSEAIMDLEELAAIFGVLAVFVVGLTIATAAILVAGRMAAQIRQVGTLKAVGVTPGQVTCVLLVEYLTVAFLATAVGLAAGTLLTPPLARLTHVLSVYGAPDPTDHLATGGDRRCRRRPPSCCWPRCGPRCAACGAAPCARSAATPGHPTGPAG